MSAALGLSRYALENRIYERKHQGIRVDVALQMQEFSQTTYFAEAVAAASGGVFIKLPDPEWMDDDVLQNKFHQLLAEFGTLSNEYLKGIEDGEIDKREKTVLSGIADNMHKLLTELMHVMFQIYCRQEGVMI